MTRILTLILLLTLVPLAGAKERVVGMSKQVYEAINEIQLLIDEESWPQVLEKLSELEAKKLTSYETSHVMNMKGYAFYQLDRMQDALTAYRAALAQPDLPNSQIRNLLVTVSQVALVMENYTASEDYARQLLASEGDTPPPILAYAILAQALIGQERYQDALEPLLTVQRLQLEAGKKPRENWMVLLSSVYFNLEDYPGMRDVVYQLLDYYPRERYILNLAALHGQLGDQDKQLALVESLLDDERLERENHLATLANLYLAQGLPFKAAGLLEAEMASGRVERTQKNLELESQAWFMAGEQAKAIPPLEQAAQMAEDGELYLRVARLYMDSYDWANAERTVKLAIDKGDLRDTGSAHLLHGMALARQEQLDRARKIFLLAAKHEKSRKYADQWIKYVDNEKQRMESLRFAEEGA